MNYRIKDIIGTSLEIVAFVGVVVAATARELPSSSYFAFGLACGSVYYSGSNLRNKALEEKILSKIKDDAKKEKLEEI